MQKNVYQGKYISVTEELRDGYTWERAHLMGWVHVFPEKDGKLLMIKEFRTHEGGSRWKFVGGWMDKDGKDHLEVAQEELLEEVSCSSGSWERVYEVPHNGQTVDAPCVYFLARDVQEVDDAPENPDEFIVEETKFVDESELLSMIDRREMNWGTDSVVALQIFRNYL